MQCGANLSAANEVTGHTLGAHIRGNGGDTEPTPGPAHDGGPPIVEETNRTDDDHGEVTPPTRLSLLVPSVRMSQVEINATGGAPGGD